MLFTSQLKHLCACRENEGAKVDGKRKQETSLRLQRKPESPGGSAFKFRNISAHAEKTALLRHTYRKPRKHLCASREDPFLRALKITTSETSLRMQRRLIISTVWMLMLRNISAHAEKTKAALVVGNFA